MPQGTSWEIFGKSIGIHKRGVHGKYNIIVSPFCNLKENLGYEYVAVNTINSKNILVELNNGLAHYDSELVKTFSSKPRAFICHVIDPGDILTLL